MVNSSEQIISHANPHTLKKFELIERYVEAWAHILLSQPKCTGIVFIDCMSNSGEYIDDNGKQVFGTPVRVAKYLRSTAWKYLRKQIVLYFSDLSAQKTAHLRSLMPSETSNFHYNITTEDGNSLAKRLGKNIDQNKHYLLIYDPYEANIDWSALRPFINNWSECIINHMVSDSMRAIKMVKTETARNKYEQTYLTEIENLIPYGSDKTAYEKRIENIIKNLRYNQSRKYYISSFPFFNEKNAIVYNLIHCTSNIKGFKLYKKSAWKTFGGKSSTKNTHEKEKQLLLNFENDNLSKTINDEFCYYIKDIAEYIVRLFKGKTDVPLDSIWRVLDAHPVFPSDDFKNEIKNELTQNYGAKTTRKTISFSR